MGFFAPNLSPRAAEAVLELERLDDPSLKVMAMGLGRTRLHRGPVLQAQAAERLKSILTPEERPGKGRQKKAGAVVGAPVVVG